MPRAKKTPQTKYGIEITKPHSKEMYAHNESVSEEMKSNISELWKCAYAASECLFKEDLEEDQAGLDFIDHEWDSDGVYHPTLTAISKAVTVVGYGSGFTVGDVQGDFERDLENAENWMMHEVYEDLCDSGLGLVPLLKEGMVGFGTPDYKYWHQDAEYINQHPHASVNSFFNKPKSK